MPKKRKSNSSSISGTVYTPARKQAAISKFYARQNLMRASIPMAAMNAMPNQRIEGVTIPKSQSTIDTDQKANDAKALAEKRIKQNWFGSEDNQFFKDGKKFLGYLDTADLFHIGPWAPGKGPQNQAEGDRYFWNVDGFNKKIPQEDNSWNWAVQN